MILNNCPINLRCYRADLKVVSNRKGIYVNASSKESLLFYIRESIDQLLSDKDVYVRGGGMGDEGR